MPPWGRSNSRDREVGNAVKCGKPKGHADDCDAFDLILDVGDLGSSASAQAQALPTAYELLIESATLDDLISGKSTGRIPALVSPPA